MSPRERSCLSTPKRPLRSHPTSKVREEPLSVRNPVSSVVIVAYNQVASADHASIIHTKTRATKIMLLVPRPPLSSASYRSPTRTALDRYTPNPSYKLAGVANGPYPQNDGALLVSAHLRQPDHTCGSYVVPGTAIHS